MTTFYLLLLIPIFFFETVHTKCGSPQLPYGAVEPQREIFDENEEIEIKCVGGRPVPHINDTITIRCLNHTWHGELSVRCTQLTKFNNVSINVISENTITPMTTSLQEAMVIDLNDKDPQTCVALDNEQMWTINFEKPKIITTVVLMVTHGEEELLHNHNFAFLSLSTEAGKNCSIKEHTHGEEIPIIFIIYECLPLEQTNSLTMHLKGNGFMLNICDIELFAVNDDDCGKHEIPIYSLVNVFKIQNHTRVAEYTCPKGYLLDGSKVKMCTADGIWKPTVENICRPKIKCEKLEINETLESMVTLHYVQLDLFGNAIPGQSSVEYSCSDATLAFAEPVIRYCMPNGVWSQIERDFMCMPKEELEMMRPHRIENNRYLIFGLIIVLLTMVGMMLLLILHSKRIIKHLNYKWREFSYKQPRKVNPSVGD
ncbi:hypothetical protein B4U79_17291 [Dinothrombium tinctorium]|uniref:Sushi domain-containing protein n=1 Tax=Dinothrombium tinctorium TaxID=1965070 RepID=A0A3S3Q5Q9_9ACAR|nr:hypothetical protein B4U79_17291 [Dinothrombium tinctorium]